MNDRATDLRLQRTYGIGIQDYYRMLAEQSGGCAICGKPPTERRLHVDHDHLYHKVKIKMWKEGDIWWAEALGVRFGSPSRKDSREVIRRRIRRASVRGLLCWQDNAAIQKFRDDPERMRSAAAYIERFKERNGHLEIYL